MYRNIAHFPNLTSLRFIAAYLVVIFHVEETRKMFGLPDLTRYSLFTHGPLAVTFFFVLSGFLITYLLLKEHDGTHRIHVRRFYFRRILRIWPLYFFMVFIGLVVIPVAVKLGRVPYEAPYESLDVAAYFVFFVPLVVNLAYGNHFLTPLWSVGVEEIYYLAWAPIVKLLHRHLLEIMVGAVVVKTLLSVWASSLYRSTVLPEALRMLQFEAMAIGGLGAYFVFYRKEPIHANLLFSKPVQFVFVLLLVMRLSAHQTLMAVSELYAAIFDHAFVTPLLLMAIFTWFIINVAVNERSIIRLDSRVLNYLGGISYGIYMYHALAISLVFVPFLDDYRGAPELPVTILLHVSVAAFTVLIAALSKAFFEDKVLWYKVRFQAVKDEGQEMNHASTCIANASRSLAA